MRWITPTAVVLHEVDGRADGVVEAGAGVGAATGDVAVEKTE